MRRIIPLVIAGAGMMVACSTGQKGNGWTVDFQALEDSITALIPEGKGEVGVAIISSDGDTLLINNEVKYPLMSVFKLHEAIAVARSLDNRGQDFDTVIHVTRQELNPDTWSPMLKDYPEGDIDITVSDLMAYTLRVSDNNTSNILYDRIVSVPATDSVCRELGINSDFSISHTEHEMQQNHALSYENWSSPLACAELIDRVYTDSVTSADKQSALRGWLGECTSATDRLAAPLADYPGVELGHRTGSGYVNERGEIVAVNDVGHFTLPDGTSYSIAVLIKDYPGPQDEASAIIGRISRTVLDAFSKKK